MAPTHSLNSLATQQEQTTYDLFVFQISSNENLIFKFLLPPLMIFFNRAAVSILCKRWKKIMQAGFKMTRRNFVSLGAAAAIDAAFPAQAAEKKAAATPASGFVVKRMSGTLEVSSIGLGCLPMVGYYGDKYEKNDMAALIRKPYDMGVTFFDTTEVYGPYTSETWVGEALEPMRGNVKIATKYWRADARR